MRKGFVTLVLVVIVLVVVTIGAVAYIQLKPQLASSPTSSQSPQTATNESPLTDEIAKGKVYINDEFGFEIKYPAQWKTREYRSQFDKDHWYLEILLPSPYDTEAIITSLRGDRQITISAMNKLHNINEFQKTGVSINEIYQELTLYQPIVFADQEASQQIRPYGKEQVGIPGTEIIFNNNGLGWSISFTNNDFEGAHYSIYDQILSTFKFLD